MERKVEKLAAYIADVRYEDLSQTTLETLKIRVLDSIGCAIGAMHSAVARKIKAYLDDFGGNQKVTLIGGGKSAPDRAALYNSALIRFLDFNDSFLAKHETCHPSDNIGAVLAASEYAKASGKQFLISLGIAYQVHCLLSQIAPVRHKGFDHTTQGIYAVAAGISKALGLDKERTAHGIAIAGVANNALRVTRTGKLSNWKGLAYPYAAFSALNGVFLAKEGITGPLEIFEGNKGLMHAITGSFEMDWNRAGLDLVQKTILKKYNAEIHSQSAIEGILELNLDPKQIKHIRVDIFDVAFHIIGGGEEGGKKGIATKEEADHSLPYMLAAALLDRQVTPAQYTEKRINSPDIQELLQKIDIHPHEEYTKAFPEKMCVRIKATLHTNQELHIEKENYEGFFTQPMSWDRALKKFDSLTLHVAPALKNQLVETIHRLEIVDIEALTRLLGQIP